LHSSISPKYKKFSRHGPIVILRKDFLSKKIDLAAIRVLHFIAEIKEQSMMDSKGYKIYSDNSAKTIAQSLTSSFDLPIESEKTFFIDRLDKIEARIKVSKNPLVF
jgi:hypothetical protein